MEETKDSYYTTISVEGMTCNHCKATVENGLSAIEGVEKVSVDLQSGEVVIGGIGVNMDKVANRLKELGYGFNGTINQ